MKKLIKKIYLIPLLILLLLAGCKNNSEIKIGIMQIVEHESLDSARQGFIDELKNLGYEEGKNIKLDIQVAGGELSNCISIAQKFVNNRKDLVLAISTPCVQTMANETRDIPILATAITDFEDLGIIKSPEKPETNITGVSDLAPIDKIVELIKELNPNVKKIGVLYSLTDPSPEYQAKIAQRKINEMGLECKMVSVSQIQDVNQVAEHLAKEVDALYTPIDKITFASMPQISKIFSDSNKFIVCAEDSMISRGAAATYGINYYDLGKIAAHQAVKILEKKENIQSMPVEYSKKAKLNLNYELIEKLKIEIPEKLKGEVG